MYTESRVPQPDEKESEPFEGYEFRILMLGAVSVGKTALVTRFIDGSFEDEYRQTLSVTQSKKRLQIVDMTGREHTVMLTISDMGGQETFRELRRQYMKGASGAIIVYDVTKPETFMSTNNIFSTFRDVCPDAAVIICANKIDLVAQRMVPIQTGIMLRNWFQTDYFETSAKTDVGVREMFMRIAELMLNKVVLQEKASVC